MLGTSNKNEIKLECKEQLFPEFQGLYFGTGNDGNQYFDATIYLNEKYKNLNIKNFFVFYSKPIEGLCGAYGIHSEDIYKINQHGHYLLNHILLYLFIAFTDPDFLGYICDRMNELFTQGVTVSDSYLLQSTKERLSSETLQMIIQDAEE